MGPAEHSAEQLAFPDAVQEPARPRRSRSDADAPSRPGPSPDAPSDRGAVARVLLDVGLQHLDRLFDYAVPPGMAAGAVPGSRVSVTFAGRDTGGFVVERAERSEHTGPLAPLRRVVSPVPVLTPDVLALVRAVATHYAGTASDVLRLAVPPRHARTESAVLAQLGEHHEEEPGEPSPAGPLPTSDQEPGPQADADVAARPAAAPAPWQEPWLRYEGGAAFVRRLTSGESPRAAWLALPGDAASSPRDAIAAAVSATLASGRGAVVVAPESREVARLGAALERRGVRHVRLLSEDGPARRYRAFLRLLLGDVAVVVGTRAAAFAPVQDVGLVALWDDGDDLLAEPRAPYPHALGVLRLRADLARAGALIGGYGRSTATQQLVEDGWARPVQAPRAIVRSRTPRVIAPDDADLAREGASGHARIPRLAWDLARTALQDGPVLVQVPRAGYVPFTACARCRTPARCRHCSGPLRIDRPGRHPACAWCGQLATEWSCPECQGGTLRAGRLGSARTAEELGRAFPSVPVVVSGATAAGGVLDAVDEAPKLVIATPGAEPEARGSYAGALLLDAAVTSGRPELWAAEEALRRWLGAAALVRPASEGGRVALLGGGAPRPAQALVRWDPAGFAERELAERAALGFPPATAMASIQGGPSAVRSFLDHVEDEADVAVLGPVPVDAPGEHSDDAAVRAIVRVDRARAADLTRALSAAAAARSARKEPGAVRVQVDPTELW